MVIKKCEHEFKIVNVDWIKMPIKYCEKCKHYEFAYQDELQKNIGYLSGYQWEYRTDN